jgi:hypothetical protein
MPSGLALWRHGDFKIDWGLWWLDLIEKLGSDFVCCGLLVGGRHCPGALGGYTSRRRATAPRILSKLRAKWPFFSARASFAAERDER